MAVREIRVQSLPEFLSIIEELSAGGEKLWFRGHESINHNLNPTIYRHPFESKHEVEFHAKFKSRAIPFLNNLPDADDYWSWLFLMQHYGVPTRLLDWSTGAMYALAFAILYRQNRYVGEDAVVWCLYPKRLNHPDRVRMNLNDDEKIPNIITNKKKVETPYKAQPDYPVDYPVAITGPLNSNRIVAQKGTFTLFPDRPQFNLEDTADAEQFLIKVIVAHANINAIKNQLIILGITETSIYPELASLGLEIRREFIEP